MKTLLMAPILILAYGFTWYAGHLVEQGSYALAVVTAIIPLGILFKLVKEN